MKYYHGTSEYAAESIDEEGFGGSELSAMTDGFTNTLQSGVLFVAETVEHAADYGEVVYEVELLNGAAVEFNVDAYGRKEYYIPISQLSEDGIWKRIS